MITRTMNPFTLRREMQKDIFDNIVPYLRRNYDSKIHRAIIKSHCLPMIFNPIHYFSKTTNNDWFIYYLKSATKLFSVLLASKRPLITELADKLRLKYPLLPTISPCPTMRLEAIRSIIPISCRRYPKSV